MESKGKMITLKCLDENFIIVRSGIEFYYFGKGCIADYYGDTIAYLDESDIAIVKMCKNKKLQSIHTIIENNYPGRLNRLFKKGVLKLSDKIDCADLVFHGLANFYYPKEIVVELTNTCNYRCPFCYKNASNKGEFISESIINELQKKISGKVNNILLTGGEPTLHPNYLKYINAFSSYAKVHMITNGSVLYKHDPKILSKLTLIQFTIYGCSDDEYFKMTGNKYGFTQLSRSIKFAKRNNINVKAAITLCDQTIGHIEDFVKVAVNFGIASLRIGIADVFGRGSYLFAENSKYSNKRDEAYDTLIELKRKYRGIIKFELPNINVHHVSNHDDIIKNVHRKSLSCGCGSEYLVISQSGRVRACQMLPESFFSIGDLNTLDEHINGDFHIKELHNAIERYYNTNQFQKLNISPCQALDDFVNLGGILNE